MVLKFCANLSFMFLEKASLIERYKIAKEVGFSAVECAFPYDVPIKDLIDVKSSTKLQQVLINTPKGTLLEGELGLAAFPEKRDMFMDLFYKALEYANALDCHLIHIMSGIVQNKTIKHYEAYEKNLKEIVPILEKKGITGVIEPINVNSVPYYYLDSYETALELIKNINSPNLKLLLDIFHLQQIKGNLTHNIESLLPFVGHIQIAQVPDRNEPDSCGEINYKYIFQLLEKHKYSEWIGLEYKPLTTTREGLNWIEKYGYSI